MYREDDCRLQADMLYSIVSDVVDKYAPVRCFVLNNNDKPLITRQFKELVEQRDRAFTSGDVVLLGSYVILLTGNDNY
jgi:hypothetical protein